MRMLAPASAKSRDGSDASESDNATSVGEATAGSFSAIARFKSPTLACWTSIEMRSCPFAWTTRTTLDMVYQGRIAKCCVCASGRCWPSVIARARAKFSALLHTVVV